MFAIALYWDEGSLPHAARQPSTPDSSAAIQPRLRDSPFDSAFRIRSRHENGSSFHPVETRPNPVSQSGFDPRGSGT